MMNYIAVRTACGRITRSAPIAALQLLLAGTFASLGHAQQRPPLELTRITAPIVVDGSPDEAAWLAVPTLPLSMYTPTFRGTPTQRTEIRVAYDDNYFYAAGWFYETDASQIRINSLYRDRWNGDDALAIYLDAFRDKKNSKWFGVTAGGTRFDQLLSDDGATTNANWDTFWTAKTTVSDSGWFVEVRIPFSSIGFRTDSTGKAVMGLTISRLIARTDERVVYPEIDPKFEFRRPSQAQEVVLHNVRSKTPVYLTPYVLGGVQQQPIALNPTGYSVARQNSGEFGADLRYPLSSNLTLDLTVNTDFAQVEADDQQVNLDRFPLFFPERRRFFQENSGIFDFVAGNNTRLFNSRRIGLTEKRDSTQAVSVSENLEPVPVLGGGRLVGRVGAFDIGVLEMQTGKGSATPSENFGVLRIRRRVINPLSTAGLMFTSFASNNKQNFSLGGDGTFHVGGDHYLLLKLATTANEVKADSSTFASRSLFDVRWERNTQKGLGFSLQTTHAARDFDPQMGFMDRRNFTAANAIGNYFIFTDKSKTFRRVYPGALAFSTYRNADGALESGQYAVWVQWDTKAGGGGWIEPKVFHENVQEAFTIGRRIHIPTGSYEFADLQLALSMASGRRIRTSVDVRSGTYFDGKRTQVILTPTWIASRHFELGASYQLTHLDFPIRNEKADIQVARLRMRVAVDPQKSGNAFIQYNSTARRLDVNVRLRYAIAEGTDLWFVYNEGLDTIRNSTTYGEQAPLSLARSMIIKYSHTLSF